MLPFVNWTIAVSQQRPTPPGRVWLQVLYVREHVFVWPNKRSRIMGRLSLTLQRHVLFIAWLPYSPAAVHAVRITDTLTHLTHDVTTARRCA